MKEKDGFDFAFDESKCFLCGGSCCKGDGYVFVEPSECEKIAEFLGLEINEFGVKYLRKIGNRYALLDTKDSIDSKDSTDSTQDSAFSAIESTESSQTKCIFLDSNNKCSIYDLRPKNCRTFPFWDIFKQNSQGAFRECMGVVKK